MKTKDSFIASNAEHRTYALYFFGQNLLWGFAAYVATYLTDIGFAAASAAAILAGPKIWDAINDALFGYIVDKCTYKNGQRFVPWIRIGVVGITFATVFMFSIPASSPMTAKAIWFLIGYLLFDACYTFMDSPAYALPTAMTPRIQERTTFLASAKLWGIIGGAISSVTIGAVRSKLGWSLSSALFCVIAAAFMMPMVFTVKERNAVGPAEADEKYSMKQMLHYLKTNRYLISVLVAFFILGMSSVETIVNLYVARICLGSESLTMVITSISAAAIALVSALVPILAKRYDKFYIMIFGLIFAGVAGVLCYFIGYGNLLVVSIFTAMKCTGLGLWQVIIYMLITDTTEYGTYKTGVKAVGITFSLQTFVSKLRGAFSSSFVLVLLSLFGFVEGENAIQPAGVASGIWFVFTIVPVIGYALAIVILLFSYKLRDSSVQVMSNYNNRVISREEAVHLLSAKYGEPENSTVIKMDHQL